MRATFEALAGRRVSVALMTSIGVTVHDSSYNRASQSHDWKRRAERLVRASGSDDTIVRPGRFDESAAAHPEPLFLQGDTRRTGSPEDDSVARSQIARVLIESVTAAAASRKTLELVAERGPRQPDLDPVFAALQADAEGALDAALDPNTLPLDREPAAFPAEIAEVARRGQSASAN
ncbi:NAD(P)H-binding protein [Pseudoclavibacter terrae]|uniref:NAD(P)H-binding protein n=1 Tax=Pseudoclavibacter terrae TaxID=1530195 RepID=UPI00232E54D7|nr:NAD(P)H-binding protein [Pseudoclavibacter terrae]